MLRRYLCACPGRPKSCDCRYKHGGYYHAHDDAGRLEFYAKNHQKILAKHYGYFDRLLTLFCALLLMLGAVVNSLVVSETISIAHRHDDITVRVSAAPCQLCCGGLVLLSVSERGRCAWSRSAAASGSSWHIPATGG